MSSTFTRLAAALGLIVGVGAAGAAAAAEAGRIVFVTGAVQAGGRALALNDAIQEGDELSTGKQAYVYLKTVDNGLLILRPDSRARIVTYHVDKVDPSKTRIKFELLSGVARSVSGDAVKLARQNFRFNTPVAAIGVRGTDFTVSTDQETSSVTVISGAIVVSGFSGSCAAAGTGPCEHTASRELNAKQTGQMLQVKRGQAAPQLMTTSPASPDAVAPPRADEPVAKAGAPAGAIADVSLDAKKPDNLRHTAELVKSSAAPPTPPVLAPNEGVTVAPSVPEKPPELPVVPVVPEVPVVVAPPEPPPPVIAPVVEQSKLVWGRWQKVLDQAPQNDNAALAASGHKEIARNPYYTIYRSKGEVFKSPEQGNVAFTLTQSEAMVMNSATNLQTAATLQNGTLSVDFGKARFATAFDLLADGKTTRLQAGGGVSADGILQGDLLIVRPTNMTVRGGLSNEANGVASYVFTSRLDDKRIVNGVTYWGK